MNARPDSAVAPAASSAAPTSRSGSTTAPARMPWTSVLAVLIGFPLFSTLLSLLLWQRPAFAAAGLPFRPLFWSLIAVWYALQIALLAGVLRRAGWRWSDIGYALDRRGTTLFVAGYLLVAFALLAFVEWALAGAGGSAQGTTLSDLADLAPRTTAERIVYVVMGLLAGLCEELVYRGFAIRALRSRGLHAALAVPLAALPFVFQHGLKSLDQFGWFFGWGLVFGIAFVLLRKLYPGIVLHWLVILSAMPAVLQGLR